MTVWLSSSSVGNIGEEQCMVSEIHKNDLYVCRKRDSAASVVGISTIPQISLYFEQRPKETLLNNESGIPLI